MAIHPQHQLQLLKAMMVNKNASKLLAACVLCFLISACTTTINHVDVSNDKIKNQKTILSLTCQYRLLAVNDKRQSGDNAGLLGLNEFSFANPEEVVSAQLVAAGMHTANDSSGSDVVIDIKHIYMSMNQSSKIPTVVYSVHVNDSKEFIIRGQAVSMIWNGNEKEAYNSFSAAFQSANSQLVTKLNQQCK